jgi:hypothetical protein
MRAANTISALAGFDRRGAGTDAERRAALRLAGELRDAGREAELQTFWCRPNWAGSAAWHVALGLAGSLLSVSSPVVGLVVVAIAMLSVIADSLTGISLGRRLTPERASQNVIGRPIGPGPRMRLIVTANYDAGRAGLAHRSWPRGACAAVRRSVIDITPGWTGWLVIALGWVIVTAILRDGGATGTAIGIAQLIPTAALVLALALTFELACAGPGPAAGDNASGVAVALALVRALDVAPPPHLAVEVVLQGAGDGGMIGLRRHLRARRRELGRRDVVVLGIAACGAGRPRWWNSDGSLLPLRYARWLRACAQRVAAAESHLGATGVRGRGLTPAFPARATNRAAITIGCLDRRGLAQRSHQAADKPQAIEPGSVDAALELALALVDAIDAELGARASASVPPAAAAAAP